MSVSSVTRLALAGTTLCVIILVGAFLVNLSGIAAPTRTLQDHVALIRPHSDLRLPESMITPVPTVIMLHGCGGLRQVQEDYAAAILDAGYAVLIIDSNGARNIGRFGAMSQVCTAMRLLGRERAADLQAALELVRENEALDGDQLAMIGWSHGGWTALDAISFSGSREPLPTLPDTLGDLPGIRIAIAMYPYCGFPSVMSGDTFDRNIRVFSILAERDAIAPTGACINVFEAARDADHDTQWEIWDGLTHAFDEPNAPALDPRIVYDEDAAARARQRIIEVLDQAFTGG